jgi:fimbrial chaperone protein
MMNLLRWTALLSAFALLVAPVRPALAGELSFRPLSLELTPQEPTGTLEVKNAADDGTRVQISAMLWTDGDGTAAPKDLKPAEDIIAFPNLVTLDKGKFRSIRVAAGGASGVERAYRVFIEELPPAQLPAAGGPPQSIVYIRTRISIPLFVTPAGAAPKPAIESLALRGGKVTFDIANSGTAHFDPKQVSVEGQNGSAVVFHEVLPVRTVLAGDHRPVVSAVALADCRKASSVTVTVETEHGRLQQSTPVSPASCAP